MKLVGDCEFISATSGTKKRDGSPWFRVKFLDYDDDEYIEIFTTGEIFQQLCDLKKHTKVQLTLRLTPGKTFVTLLEVAVEN